MALTTEDITKLQEVFGKPNQQKDHVVQKVAIALITFALIGLITYVFSGIQTLKANDSIQTKDIEYVKLSMEEIKEFTRQPRYTQEDADAQHKPMDRRLDKIEATLNTRSTFIDRTQERLSKLEYQIQNKK